MESHPLAPPSGAPAGDGRTGWVAETTAPALDALLADAPRARAALLDALADARARGVEHLHLEPTADGWRLRQRVDELLTESRLERDDPLAEALCRLDQRLPPARPPRRRAPDAAEVPASRVFLVRLPDAVADSRRLVELGRDGGDGTPPAYLLTLHDDPSAPPRLDACGLDAAQSRGVRERLATAAPGWIAVGGDSALQGARTVRAIGQELVSPERRLLALEGWPHPTLAGVTQTLDERDLVPVGAFDTDVALLVASPADTVLRALAARAAEHLLVVHHCRVRRPSDVLRRLLSLGLTSRWIALSCPFVLMQHRVRLVCHHCRVRELPGEGDAAAVGPLDAPPVQDVSAWLERSMRARFRAGTGCERCHGSGQRGLRTVVDVIVPDTTLRARLLAGDEGAALARIDTSGSLRRRLSALLERGEITSAEAARHLAGRY